MKIQFEIALSKLLAECQHQSLIDSQAIRTESGQSVVGEMALSDKNKDIFFSELASQVSRLYSAFANLVQFEIKEDAVLLSVTAPEVEDPSFTQAVAINLKDYLKFAMMAWWSLSRKDSTLYAAYLAKQDEARSFVLNLITPKVERKYRYW